jgi:hypothetical protein
VEIKLIIFTNMCHVIGIKMFIYAMIRTYKIYCGPRFQNKISARKNATMRVIYSYLGALLISNWKINIRMLSGD